MCSPVIPNHLYMFLEDSQMFRRYFFPILACTVLTVSSTLLVSAQTGELRGHVIIRQADGTNVPVADAIIDVFRTDIPGKYSTKTDKKGQFVFAGLPYVGTYIIAASKAESQPNWINDAKAGRDANYEIDLKPGDGKRLTLEEIKGAAGRTPAAAAGTAKLSAEEKAKLEEMERKNAEITARNEKSRNANEVVARTFKAGNEALGDKNYDEAIKQFEEGLAADPQQPALLTNEGAAYKARGVARYNAGVKAKDDATKTSGIESAKADFKAAAAATSKAVALIKSMPAPTDSAALANYNNNKLAAITQNADAMRLLVTKVDPTQADAGFAAYQELIAMEPDAAKKQKAQLDATLMLLDAGSSDKALQSAQKILETDPDNVEALRLAGLALFQSGDKAKFQEAANYLQRFVDKAPDTHPDKQSAKESLDYLKTAENVKPVKTTPTTTTRRGGKKP